MTIVNRSLWYVAAAMAFAVFFATVMTGCQTCPVGQEIVIPTSDTTDPSLAVDFFLPDGTVVTVTPGSAVSTIAVPGGGWVTVIAKAQDPEGVQDAQIWAASITWTTDPNTGLTTRSGPGLLGAPTASNRDGRSQGQKGCTERLVSQKLEVRSSPRGGVSYEVSARGINFGGGVISTPLVSLHAQ